MKNIFGMRLVFSLLMLLTAGATVKEACAVNHLAPAGTIGVNKFDLFTQYTGTASRGDGGPAYRRVTRAMAKKALDDAKDAGVKYMRVSMSGRTSSQPGDGRDSLDLWRSDPETFWAQVDDMMDDLDVREIQIVPVLAWSSGKFPLWAGETTGEMFRNSESKSWGLLSRFVTEFVTRYRKRPTVLFYELSNELNNYVDLDLMRRCKKKSVCDEGDRFTADDLVAYTRRFAGLIRSLDNTRLISSGFSIPRGSAEHLRARPEWTTRRTDWRPDTREQFAKNLKEIHAGVDIISIHLYGGKQNWRFGSNDAVDLLVEAKRVADEVGKPLFVGEFGDPNSTALGDRSHAVRMMNKIVELRIPYSAIWVWEFYQKSTYSTHDNRHNAFSLEPGYTDPLIDRLRKINGESVKEVVPPRVVLTWPLACAQLMKTTTVYAVASDDQAVDRVEFWLDEVMLKRDDTPPYQTDLVLSGVVPGSYRLTAKAYDRTGKMSSYSTPVTIGGGRAKSACEMGEFKSGNKKK